MHKEFSSLGVSSQIVNLGDEIRPDVCLLDNETKKHLGNLHCHFIQGILNDKKNVWLLRLSSLTQISL